MLATPQPTRTADEDAHAIRVAAIALPHGGDIADLFAALAVRLRGHGLKVAGLSQRRVTPSEGARCTTLVEDLTDGHVVDISQALGAGSTACNLDVARLAETAARLGAAAASDADVFLVAKFGKMEAQGEGLRDELAMLIASGRPVVVAVGETLLPAFAEFLGESPALLPADVEAITAWCAGG